MRNCFARASVVIADTMDPIHTGRKLALRFRDLKLATGSRLVHQSGDERRFVRLEAPAKNV